MSSVSFNGPIAGDFGTVRTILEEYASRHNLNIFCHGYQGGYQSVPYSPPEDDALHIHLQATPGEVNEYDITSEIEPALNSTLALRQSGQGSPLVYPRSRFICGELIERSLYVLCDISQSTDMAAFLRKILDQTFMFLSATGLAGNTQTPVSEDQPRSPEHPVTVAKWHSDASSSFVARIKSLVSEKLSPLIKRPVSMSAFRDDAYRDTYGRYDADVHDDAFCIFMFHSFNGGGVNRSNTCHSAWSMNIGDNWNWWRYSDSTEIVPIMNPDSNEPIAELLPGRALYIYPPLGNGNIDNGLDILAKIFDEAAKIIADPAYRYIPPRVRVSGNWNGYNREGFLRTSSLLESVAENVILHVPHAHHANPTHVDGEFHVWIWSSPFYGNEDRYSRPAEKMFGVTVDCTDKTFDPSPFGETITDEAGTPVAELFGDKLDNLYIFHDICDVGTENELRIYEAILNEVVRIKSLPEAELLERKHIREQKKARYERRKELVVVHDHSVLGRSNEWYRLSKQVSRWLIDQSELVEQPTQVHYIRDRDVEFPEGSHLHVVFATSKVALPFDDMQVFESEDERFSMHWTKNYVQVVCDRDYDYVDRKVYFAALADVISKAIVTDEQMLVDLASERREQADIYIEKKWVRLLTIRRRTELKELEEKVRNAQAHVQHHQQEVVSYMRKHDDALVKLNRMRETSAGIEEVNLQQLKKIKTLPGVVKVSLRDDVIEVYTETIIITYDGDNYLIGDFRVDIHTGKGYASLHNLTHAYDGKYDHPHVVEHSPCYGNLGEAIPELIGKYQYAVAASLCVQYLKSYNPRGPYLDIYRGWKKVKPTETEVAHETAEVA